METFPDGIKTETELFIYLFEKHPLYGITPHLVIDAPKQILVDGTIRRLNTFSTVVEWLKTNPEKGSCLAISTQPFVGRQEAVLRSLLPIDFEVEAVGPQMKREYPLSIYLDNFAKWLKYEQEKPPSAYLSH